MMEHSSVTTVKATDGAAGTTPARRAPLTALAGVALGAIICAGTARAQSGDDITLDTIQVQGERASGPVNGYVGRRSDTATKTDTPLIETPQSVTVVTRQQMADQGAQSVGQALRYTASVLAETRLSAGRYDSAFIRGFGGSGGGAGFINNLDGLRYQRGVSFLVPAYEPWGLERVEVLRGPSSVVFGQVKPGGIVNMVSKRPKDEAHGEVQLQFGSYQRAQMAFDIGGPIDPEKTWLYRVVGLGRAADTQVDFTREERIFVAPSVTYRPNGATSFTLMASFQRDPETGFYGFIPAVGTVLPSRAGRIRSDFFPGEPSYEGYSRNQANLGYAFEHRFNDVFSFRQNVRVSDLESRMHTVAVAGIGADQRTLTRRVTASNESARTAGIDNQLQADFRTGPLTHKLLFGIDGYWMDGKAFTGAGGTVQTLDFTNPIYGRRPFVVPAIPGTSQTTTQYGVYLQDQIKLDRLSLLVGGRFDSAEARTRALTTGVLTKQDDTARTGRVALMYNFDNGFAPYASYSTSFEPVAGTTFAGTPFKPTEGEQYEVGFKYELPGANAFIQAAAYELTQTNVSTSDLANVGFQVQTGEVRARGIEVEARATVFDNLDLIAAYAYTDAEVTKSNGVDLGKRPTVVPRHMASLWGHYTFRTGMLAGLGLGAGVRYVGEGAGDPGNTFFTPDYTLVDAAISYDFGAANPALKAWKLQVNAHNLFDKEYISGCYAAVQCSFGLRRTVLATLSYRW
ncbi:TonB-dependent siderophore receptor [Bosea sp. 124]|uniref:TonB-dependent siderophore receptor n=1 Tax=Bosea sp. 124 TaxID=2135642 RepID=UPI000D45ED65|nr:TonB-dependent siderophore receptor [Bosea sp. 124]PTM41814.1 iron complex outermembrane receptor protein [Bosea sp. 124]